MNDAKHRQHRDQHIHAHAHNIRFEIVVNEMGEEERRGGIVRTNELIFSMCRQTRTSHTRYNFAENIPRIKRMIRIGTKNVHLMMIVCNPSSGRSRRLYYLHLAMAFCVAKAE